jgi:transcriptional regulator with XRE-family HTH domain
MYLLVNKKIIGKTLICIREIKEFSQKEIARGLKIDTTILSKYEHGVKTPEYNFVENFCNFCNITLTEFEEWYKFIEKKL